MAERERERETIDLTINKPNTIERANCIMARYDCGISNQQQIGTGVIEPARKQN